MTKILSTPFGVGIAVTVDADPTTTPHVGIPRGSVVVFDDGVAAPRCFHKHDNSETDAGNTIEFVMASGGGLVSFGLLRLGGSTKAVASGDLSSPGLFYNSAAVQLGVGTTTPKKTLHCAKDGVNPSVLLLENSRPNTEGSIDETVRTTFGFGGITNAVLWVAFKEDDFTELAKESAGIEIHTRKEGNTSVAVRIGADGTMTVLRGGTFTLSPSASVSTFRTNNANARMDFTTARTESASIAFRFTTGTGIILDLDDAGRVFVKLNDLFIQGAAKLIRFTGTPGGGNEGITYKDAGGTDRIALTFPGSDVVAVVNRAANGTVQIRANTATPGGGAAEVTVATFADTDVTLASGINLLMLAGSAYGGIGIHGAASRDYGMVIEGDVGGIDAPRNPAILFRRNHGSYSWGFGVGESGGILGVTQSYFGIVDQLFGVVFDIAPSTGNARFRAALEIIGDLQHRGEKLGHYGTAPIVKQTGIAVTAAGVHAALVNLGLIAA